MRDFNRKNLSFSLCGLNCGLCPMFLDGYCPGCGGGAGNQSCAIAKCSLQHDHVEYCFLCPAYPCQRYEGMNQEGYDSFITHQRQLRDMERAKEIGISAYNEEQAKKVQILKTLLSNYNDGRRKSFYCVAVNLLPLPDLESVMILIEKDSAYTDRTIKENAKRITLLFENIALREKVNLKLRKKPVKK